ncbi:hypothetical protein [Paraburkholderia ginsengiterrae]|uniref:hypothetical protein n=1 Tax=Paraburkholderia ginsengiterrae TaxID=1462993 RepID=UPI000A692E81|nr:hypothetical protein [Paraburkholderia ginsengiterrae]
MRQTLVRPEQNLSLSRNSTPEPARPAAVAESYALQRTELLCALVAAERSALAFTAGTPGHIKAKARVTRLQNNLRLLNHQAGGTRKRQNLVEFLVEIFRERVRPNEWAAIVAEARRRHDAQLGGAAPDGEPLARG